MISANIFFLANIVVSFFIQSDLVYSSSSKFTQTRSNNGLKKSETNARTMLSGQLVAKEGKQQVVKKKKRHLVVVAVEVPPFMMSRKLSEPDPSLTVGLNGKNSEIESRNIKTAQERNRTGRGEQIEWFGYCVDFFEELIKLLPYEVTYEIYTAPSGNFGSKTKRVILDKDERTGKVLGRKEIEEWGGVIGELFMKRAHIALTPLAVMAERELVIDFTVPFYDLVGIQILLKKPEVPKDWFKFLTVLDNDVWLSILIAYFITSFVIYLFDRLSPYSNKNLTKIQRLRFEKGRGQRIPSSSSPFMGNRISLDGPNKTSGPLLSAIHESPGRLFSTRLETIENTSDRFAGGHTELLAMHDSLATKFRRMSREYMQSLGFRPNVTNIAGKSNIVRSEKIDMKDENYYDNYKDEYDEEEEEEEEDSQGAQFNLRDSFWFCITSLTPQGGGEAPQNLSGRVVAGAWWLFCFIVIASYTANLAAFLTVSRLDIPIESLDDLAKQYRIKFAPMDGTAEKTYFERMAYIEEIFYNVWKGMALNDSLSEEERSKFAVWDYPISDKYTKIWSQIQEVGMPQDLSESIARVKNSTIDDGFALLADANFVKYATMTDCSFKAVGDEFSRKPIALGVTKGEQELRDDLSYAILQLINRRFMEVLREKWWTNNEARMICEDSAEESSEGMSIENIGGVFIIIFAGVIFSFIVWTIERFVYRTKLEVSRNLINSAGRNPGLKRSI